MVGGRAFLMVLVFVFTVGTQAIAQTMTAPDITSEGPFLVDEGETAVATLTADDSDTATTDLIWTNTGGADSAKFSLTSAGVLTFSAAKDYEAPDDVDADGTYEVTVQVSDGTEIVAADGSATGLAFATVVVANVELPEFPSERDDDPQRRREHRAGGQHRGAGHGYDRRRRSHLHPGWNRRRIWLERHQSTSSRRPASSRRRPRSTTRPGPATR